MGGWEAAECDFIKERRYWIGKEKVQPNHEIYDMAVLFLRIKIAYTA